MYVSRQVAKMDAKKFIACFEVAISSIFLSLSCLLCLILWIYISTNLTSVHHSVNETNFQILECGNLNFENHTQYERNFAC